MQYSAAAFRLAIIALQVVIAPSYAQADQSVNLLPNGGGEIAGSAADVPAEWFAASVPAPKLKMGRDVKQPHSGAACLFISNDADYKQEVSNNWAQRLRYIPRGRAVQVRGYIRTEQAEAANICVQCWGPGGESLIGFASTPVIRGDHGWTEAQSERLIVPPETTMLMVRAALTGKGRAFFDDVELDIVGPEVLDDPGLAAAVKGRILSKIPLTKDSMILSYMPTWKHGNVDNVGVANNEGGVRARFAWSNPPAKPQTSKRQFLLALYSRETRVREKPGALQMYEILEDWNESSSWNEQPRVAVEPVQSFDMTPEKGWKIFDVTSLVEEHLKSAKPLHGVLLRFGSEDLKADDRNWSGYKFVSREGIGDWESRRPVLLLVDTGQPARAEIHDSAAKAPAALALSSSELLEYVEYLASLPNVAIRPVTGDVSALAAARQEASDAQTKNFFGNLDPRTANMKLHATQIPPFERFVASYPLTIEGVMTMSSILPWSYYNAGRGQEAERMTTAASRLGANTELSALVEINRASTEALLGKHEAAESRLRRVMAQTPTTPEDRRTSDILLVAPLALADLLRDRHQQDEADRLYREVADRGMQWDRKHPDPSQSGASYVTPAYRGRIELVMARNPPDIAAAEKLIDEARKRIPSAGDALQQDLITLMGQSPPVGAGFRPQQPAPSKVNPEPKRPTQEDSKSK
jgi:hypothetical protein